MLTVLTIKIGVLHSAHSGHTRLEHMPHCNTKKQPLATTHKKETVPAKLIKVMSNYFEGCYHLAKMERVFFVIGV